MRIDHLHPHDWPGRGAGWIQQLGRLLLRWPGAWWTRYRAYGHEPRVPETDGFLLAPGPHGAYVDPFYYALGQGRRLRFMAKYEVLEWVLVGRLIRWAGGFPVHRGARSSTALEIARHVLEAGDGLVIFMEGRLVLEHDRLGQPRNGLARLALATGAPVVPAGMWGNKRPSVYGRRWWWYRPTVTVVWGEPVRFELEHAPSEERVAQVREAIWVEVQRCFDAARTIAHMPGGRPPAGTPLAAMLTTTSVEPQNRPSGTGEVTPDAAR